MKKVLLFIFLFSGLSAFAMEERKKLSQEEEVAVAKLIQIKYGAARELSPQRTKYRAVAPNIRKHRKAAIVSFKANKQRNREVIEQPKWFGEATKWLFLPQSVETLASTPISQLNTSNDLLAERKSKSPDVDFDKSSKDREKNMNTEE